MNSEEEEWSEDQVEWSGEEIEWRCQVEGEELEEEPVTVGRRRRGGRKSKLSRLLVHQLNAY